MRRCCLFVIGVFFSVSGCSYLNRTIPNLNLPEAKTTTTQVGAASGAVAGASLGLLVGSMSGEAGQGMLIGSLAGATTGGMIGGALENQEKEVERRRRELSENDKLLIKQRSDIKELRRDARDYSFSNSDRSREILGSKYTKGSEAIKERGLLSSRINKISAPVPKSVKEIKKYNIPEYDDGTYVKMEAIRVGRRDDYDRRVREDFVDSLIDSHKPSSLDRGRGRPFLLSSSKSSTLGRINSFKKNVPSKIKALRPEKPSSSVYAKRDIKRVRARLKNTYNKVSSKVSPSKTLAKKRSKTVVKKNKRLEAPSSVILSKKRREELKKVDNWSSSVNSIKVKEPTKIIKPTALVTNRCEEANKEALKAKKASNNKDKLFYFRRAMKLCPDSSEFHLEVGYLYSLLGREDDARIEFRRVLELDPDNMEAKEQLSLLEE